MNRNLRHDINRERYFRGTASEVAAEHTRGIIPGRLYSNSDTNVLYIQNKDGSLKVLETGDKERHPSGLTQPIITGPLQTPINTPVTLTASGSVQTFVDPNTIIDYIWTIGLDVVYIGNAFETPELRVIGDTLTIGCFAVDDFGNVSLTTTHELTAVDQVAIRPFRTDFRSTADLGETGTFYIDPGTDDTGNPRTATVISNDIVQISGTTTFSVTTWMNYTVTSDNQYVGHDSENVCNLSVNSIPDSIEILHCVVNEEQLPPNVDNLTTTLSCPVDQSETGTFTIQGATDPNGDDIVYDIVSSSTSFVLSGQVSNIPEGGTVNYSMLASAIPGTPFTLSVIAKDDGGRTTTKVFNCMVTSVTNTPPVVTNLDWSLPCPLEPGDAGNFTVQGATDPDGDTVTYTLTTADPSFSMINNTNVSEGGTVLYSLDGNSGTDRDITVTITANDDQGGSTSKIMLCHVGTGNTAPDVSGLGWDLSCPLYAGNTGTFTVQGATDTDGDTVTYDVITTDTYFSLSNNIGVAEGGTVNYTLDPNTTTDRDITVTISAKDGNGGITNKVLTCHISVSAPPNIDNVTTTLPCPITTGTQGTFDIQGAVDPGGATLTYNVTNDSANGVVAFTNNTSVAEGGSANYSVDEDPNLGGQTFNITVDVIRAGSVVATKVISCSITTNPAVVFNDPGLYHNFPATVVASSSGNYKFYGWTATYNGTTYPASYRVSALAAIVRTDSTSTPFVMQDDTGEQFTFSSDSMLSPAVVSVTPFIGDLDDSLKTVSTTITGTNTPPDASGVTIGLTSPQELCDTGTFTIQGGTDLEAGAVTYSIVISPANMVFTPNIGIAEGGTVAWTAGCSPSELGAATITVTVHDQDGATDTKQFPMNITAPPPSGLVTQMVETAPYNSGTGYNWTATGSSDPLGGDITYSIASNTGNATWAITDTTGPDGGGTVTVNSQNVTTSITVEATSSVSGLSETSVLSITSEGYNPPNLSGMSLNTPSTMYTNNSYGFTLSGGSDPEGGTLTVSVLSSGSGSNWSISDNSLNDGAGGSVTATTTGTKSVTFRVQSSVSGLTTDKSFSRNFIEQNQPPNTSSMSLVVNGGSSITTGSTYNYVVSGASDPGGGSITYSYVSADTEHSFSAPSSGSGTCSATTAGSHNVTFRAHEPGGLTTDKTFSVTWAVPANQPPAFNSPVMSSSHGWPLDWVIGGTMQFILEISLVGDPDHTDDQLRISIFNYDTNEVTFTPNTNIIPEVTTVVAHINGSPRDHMTSMSFSIMVEDPLGASDSRNVSVLKVADPLPVLNINNLTHDFPATGGELDSFALHPNGLNVVYHGITYIPDYHLDSYNNVSEHTVDGDHTSQTILAGVFGFGYRFGVPGSANLDVSASLGPNITSGTATIGGTVLNVAFEDTVTLEEDSGMIMSLDHNNTRIRWTSTESAARISEWSATFDEDVGSTNGSNKNFECFDRDSAIVVMSLGADTWRDLHYGPHLIAPSHKSWANNSTGVNNLYGTTCFVTWGLGNEGDAGSEGSGVFGRAVTEVWINAYTSTGTYLFSTPNLIASTGGLPTADKRHTPILNLPGDDTGVVLHLYYKKTDTGSQVYESGGGVACVSKAFRGSKFDEYVETTYPTPTQHPVKLDFEHNGSETPFTKTAYITQYQPVATSSTLYPANDIKLETPWTVSQARKAHFGYSEIIPILDVYGTGTTTLKCIIGFGNAAHYTLFAEWRDVTDTGAGNFVCNDDVTDTQNTVDLIIAPGTPTGHHNLQMCVTDGVTRHNYTFTINLI